MGVMKLNNPKVEGDFFNRWMYSRMFLSNQNVLTVTTGSTGSGKSYQDLRRFELWYERILGRKPPIDNICFSVGEVMRLVASDKLKKGDIIILEEAGANMGSLDFQSKVSKMFTYIVQSFRSLNIGLFFNLPHIGMLNKQIRTLVHVQFVTKGIDDKRKVAKSTGYVLQVNQRSGKVYPKKFRFVYEGVMEQIDIFEYALPSPWIIEEYEKKKRKFVIGLATEFAYKIDNEEKDNIRRLARKDLTDRQQQVYDLRLKGWTQKKIGETLGVHRTTVTNALRLIKKKGYPIGKGDLECLNPNTSTF